MKDLLLEYKKTKELTVCKIQELKEQINAVTESLNHTRSERKKEVKESELSILKAEKSLYSSCKSDLEYAIFWMEHGHAPGATRGIERRAVYEREYAFDPLVMQRYFRSNQPEYPWETSEQEGYDKFVESVIDTDEREIIEYALQGLTEKEREMYILFVGKSMSQYKIADMLYVTRNTVKTTIARAKRKINNNVKQYKESKGDL